jgi:hypothetical protein
MALVRGELFVPHTLVVNRQPCDLEALLRARGLLPLTATACRWRMDPVRMGWVVEYEVAFPEEGAP